MTIPELICCMTVPLVLYIAGFIRSRRYEIAGAIIFFAVGLLVDWYGTIQMFNLADKFIWSFHPILGLTAISLMTLEMLVGAAGLYYCSDKIQSFFRRSLPWTFGLWLISFLTGALAHIKEV